MEAGNDSDDEYGKGDARVSESSTQSSSLDRSQSCPVPSAQYYQWGTLDIAMTGTNDETFISTLRPGHG